MRSSERQASAGLVQVLAQEAIETIVDDVARAHHVMPTDGDAAGEGFQNDEPKGLGARWKHHHVRDRQPIDEFLAVLIADKCGTRSETRFKALSLGPVADNELRAG